eukprot:2963563-Rhodomonas_salina.1
MLWKRRAQAESRRRWGCAGEATRATEGREEELGCREVAMEAVPDREGAGGRAQATQKRMVCGEGGKP